jgi:L-ascorbate metabolism protein UlaG (beta-lactamase superfamily)
MSTALTFLGAAGYIVEGPTHRVLIDPFLRGLPNPPMLPEELETPDLILVSHAAPDHLGDTFEIALRTGAPVVCDAAVARIMLDAGLPVEQVRATIWGVVVEVAGVVVRPVECRHWSSGTLRNGDVVVGSPLAFIIETEPGIRIYHYGDTSIFDMRLIGELYRPTVGLLGPTVPHELAALVPGAGRILTGEMDADECARVAEMLQLRLAVACHYVERDDEVARFLELVPTYDTTGTRTAIAPAVGERIILDPDRLEETRCDS